MDRTVALEALKEANQVLRRLGASYWVDCGSLLGIVRDNAIMEHDLDVDFSCWDWQRHQEIHDAMVAAGFEPFCTHGKPEWGYEQRFKYKGVKVDIFYFYEGTVRNDKPVEDPGLCWQGSWDRERLIVSEFPTDIVSKTKLKSFAGTKVPVPIEFEAMLVARYNDWLEPKTKWDWRTDPFCIVTESKGGSLDDVTFVIKTFMRPQSVLKAVRSIRQNYGDVPVIVVDDSDSDLSRLKHYNARLLTLPYDSGLSKGRNEAIKLVETSRVVLLDDDMIVTHRTRAQDLLTLLDHADVVCGSMRQNSRIIQWQGTYDFTQDGGLRLVPYDGAFKRIDGVRCAEVEFGLNVLCSTTEFLRKHPWDEELKLSEHTDFYLSLKKAGAKVLFAPGCIVEHKPVRTPEYRAMRRRKEFRLRFFAKHRFAYHVGYSGHVDTWTDKDEAALKELMG